MRAAARRETMTTVETGLKADARGFYHPSNEEQLIELIRIANRDGLQIRVRGSAHSVPASIYTDGFGAAPAGKRGINVMLDRLAAVTFDEARMQVTAQAGCHLGRDPR